MKDFLIWVGLLFSSTAAFGGGADKVYVDPLINEVFEAEGFVDVLVKLKGAELPVELPEERLARGKVIAAAREKQFDADKKSLLGYMRGHEEGFEVILEIPRSLTVVARIKDKDSLAQLIQFQRVRSLHYAHRNVTSDYSTGRCFTEAVAGR